MRRWLPPLVLAAALIGLWQIAASSGFLDEVLGLENILVPSPAEIASALWDNRTLLAENTWVTGKEILLGIGLALLCGLAFAVALRLSATLRHATYPLLVASQAIPIVVFAPILVVLFGYGIGPKLAIIAVVCFFPITVSALAGLRSVEPDAVKLMRSLDASRWQIFRRLEAPTALPGTFAGIRIAVAFAPIAAVFAEWSGAAPRIGGLGVLVREDGANLETARLFADATVLAALALALFGLAALAQRLVVTWR